jgi:site-specific DNA recombinase
MEVSSVSVSGYVRVSTQRQAQAQTIDQQLDRLRSYAQQQGWTLKDANIFRDDGYSGASLNRPGWDRLRDGVRSGETTHVLMTAPDRLARSYVHQVLLMEEFKQLGCTVTYRPYAESCVTGVR